MKKLSTVLLAAVFMISAGASFAATNAIQNYQAKRNAAIQKQDAKLTEIQKKQEEAKKKNEADKAALKKKQEQRKEAVKSLKDSFKY